MGLKEYIFGQKSENIATEFLKKLDYEILERNFRSKFGEIDIIATKENILHFVEVKATAGNYESAYRVTPKKLEKILKAIDFYIFKNGSYGNFQIDLITINKGKIKFIQNITN